MTLSGVFPLLSSCKASKPLHQSGFHYCQRFGGIDELYLIRKPFIPLCESKIFINCKVSAPHCQSCALRMSNSNLTQKSIEPIISRAFPIQFKAFGRFVVKSNWIFLNFSFLAGIVELICSPWLGHFSDFSFNTETFFGANHSFLWLQHDSKNYSTKTILFLALLFARYAYFHMIFSCFADMRRVTDLRPPYSIQIEFQG